MTLVVWFLLVWSVKVLRNSYTQYVTIVKLLYTLFHKRRVQTFVPEFYNVCRYFLVLKPVSSF